jgi:hypothetical protein
VKDHYNVEFMLNAAGPETPFWQLKVSPAVRSAQFQSWCNNEMNRSAIALLALV